mmetsp:Transcript_89992/g.291247  ORF Transcript_89992/g.291247 Transcript_89992/m.291247 type:complete len:225 (-) Transcript_89992:257-931(-)
MRAPAPCTYQAPVAEIGAPAGAQLFRSDKRRRSSGSWRSSASGAPPGRSALHGAMSQWSRPRGASALGWSQGRSEKWSARRGPSSSWSTGASPTVRSGTREHLPKCTSVAMPTRSALLRPRLSRSSSTQCPSMAKPMQQRSRKKSSVIARPPAARRLAVAVWRPPPAALPERPPPRTPRTCSSSWPSSSVSCARSGRRPRWFRPRPRRRPGSTRGRTPCRSCGR